MSDKEKREKWVNCQYCGMKVKEKNLESHLMKMHPKESGLKVVKKEDIKQNKNENKDVSVSSMNKQKIFYKKLTVFEPEYRSFVSNVLAEFYECPIHRLTEDEEVDFECELRSLVLNLILDELKENIEGEDGLYGIDDILDIDKIVEFISDNARLYLEDDQNGKWDEIFNKIVEWGKKKGVVKFVDKKDLEEWKKEGES